MPTNIPYSIIQMMYNRHIKINMSITMLNRDWKCSAVEEYLPSIHEAVGDKDGS
jgi:hypothetical protein